MIALEESAKKSNVVLIEREVEAEHVHMVAEIPLTMAPTEAIGKIKNISARIIFASISKLKLRYPQ